MTYSQLSTAKDDLTRNRWDSPLSGIGENVGPAGQVKYWRDRIDPARVAEFDEWVRQNITGETGLGSMGAAQTLPDPRFDIVANPQHYTAGKIEVWDFIVDQGLSYLSGNVVKYIARAGKKDPAKHIQDLEKAQAYIAREIERVKGGAE